MLLKRLAPRSSVCGTLWYALLADGSDRSCSTRWLSGRGPSVAPTSGGIPAPALRRVCTQSKTRTAVAGPEACVLRRMLRQGSLEALPSSGAAKAAERQPCTTEDGGARILAVGRAAKEQPSTCRRQVGWRVPLPRRPAAAAGRSKRAKLERVGASAARMPRAPPPPARFPHTGPERGAVRSIRKSSRCVELTTFGLGSRHSIH
eukprot:scaffold6685_cov202-Prasinococcus_capsulatus_cf.AAC.11